jgi:hypothetical protein
MGAMVEEVLLNETRVNLPTAQPFATVMLPARTQRPGECHSRSVV